MAQNIRITMPKLKMHLTKSCPTPKERQRVNQLLKTTKGQNALKAGLEQAIAKECQAMVSRGQAGWANDPAINYAVLHRDWLTAKAQSSRTGVLAARNTAVAAMFDAAIAAEKFFITTNPQSRNNRLMFTTEVKLKLITVRTPGP